LTYDTATDRLLTESFQGNTRIYTYNWDGSVKTLTDPNGNTFNYVYDMAGRMVSDGYASYAYNGNGNLLSITRDTKAIRFSYDGLNRVSSTLYDGFTVGYNYDNVGNVTKIIYPGNKAVTYTYDAVNHLKTVTDWNNKTTTYNYRNDGSLLQSVYPNNVITTYSYDLAGRQTGLVTKRGNGSVIAEYSYILDSVGNHTREDITEPLVSFPSMNKPLINYTYNAANRIQTADSTSFTFDFNGNTTGKTGYIYTSDVKNNLTSVSGRFNANYTYDGAGLRREASCNGVVKKYVLDILGMSKVLMETNTSGAPLNYYVYGLGIISRIKPDNSTNYYVSDFRGSTVAMVDGSANANITHKYSYDDFGAVIKSVEADFNPFRYVGKYGVMYEDSSLVFMRARYYDNSIGRFLSEDPVWSVNLYTYADNNPITKVDPDGKIAANLGIGAISATYSMGVQVVDNISSGKAWYMDTGGAGAGGFVEGFIVSFNPALAPLAAITGSIVSRAVNDWTYFRSSSFQDYVDDAALAGASSLAFYWARKWTPETIQRKFLNKLTKSFASSTDLRKKFPKLFRELIVSGGLEDLIMQVLNTSYNAYQASKKAKK
jgi:RHS repeat-associated protein